MHQRVRTEAQSVVTRVFERQCLTLVSGLQAGHAVKFPILVSRVASALETPWQRRLA